MRTSRGRQKLPSCAPSEVPPFAELRTDSHRPWPFLQVQRRPALSLDARALPLWRCVLQCEWAQRRPPRVWQRLQRSERQREQRVRRASVGSEVARARAWAGQLRSALSSPSQTGSVPAIPLSGVVQRRLHGWVRRGVSGRAREELRGFFCCGVCCVAFLLTVPKRNENCYRVMQQTHPGLCQLMVTPAISIADDKGPPRVERLVNYAKEPAGRCLAFRRGRTLLPPSPGPHQRAEGVLA